LICAVLLVAIGATAAHGAAFFVQDNGTKAIGRGGAVVATGNDLMTVWQNPACLAKHHGTNFKIEINWGTYPIRYQREKWHNAITSDNPGDPVPMVALASDFTLKRWVFAFSAWGPYGYGAYYPKDSDARYTGIDVVTIAALLHLTVAWQPLDWFAVGAGGYLILFAKDDQYAFSLLNDQNVKYDVIADFEASSFESFTWDVGVWFRPWEHLEIGASYFPAVKINIYGTVSAELPDLYGALVGMDHFEDDVTLRAWFADIIRFGVAYVFEEGTDIEVNVVYTTWSRLEQFDVDFKAEELISDFKVPKDSNDVWNFRAGGEVRLLDWLSVRAGYNFEQKSVDTEINSPGGVETDRHQVGTGLSLYAWGCEVDLGYMHVFQQDIHVPAPTFVSEGLGDGRGYYESATDLFNIAFNINFGDFYRAIRRGDPPRHRVGKGLL
jgi:long-chain fatty acid transport protein